MTTLSQNIHAGESFPNHAVNGLDYTLPTSSEFMKQASAHGVIEYRFLHPHGRFLDATTSTIIHASVAFTVSRMTRSEDGSLCIMTAAEKHLDNEVTNATYVASEPLHIKLPSSQTVSSYLETVQQQVQNLSFRGNKGNNACEDTSSAGEHAPPFQINLLVRPQDMTSTQRIIEALQDNVRLEGNASRVIILDIQIGLNNITVTTMSDSSTLVPWVTQRMLTRLESVICQMSGACAETTLMDIDIMSAEDLKDIWSWNTAVPTPVQRCVHDVVMEKSQVQPTAPAVCAWDGDLTYAELEQFSTTLACQLVDLGVHADVLIPLCFEKSKWATIAMLGVLKAGGGFLLLDPALPEQRLRVMLEQIGSEILLSSIQNTELSLRLSKTVIKVGPGLAKTSGPVTRLQANPQSPTTAMFAVFTSGSTGIPKGVVLTHENFCSSVGYQLDRLRFTPEARVFDFASYAFDIAVHNVFATFVSGGCLCIPSEKDRKENLTKVMIDMRATIADLTPTVADLLDPEALPDLKTIILAGEAVTTKTCERWWGKAHIVNAYGPAECHICVVNGDASCPEEATWMGKGAGVVTWVVDPDNHDRLLPPGCTGELLIEGPIVGRGYLNDAQKTAASFIHDPRWLLQGSFGHQGRRGRLYKTGDMVLYGEDGSLLYVSRKDTQVKIRGQRVELGEIERCLEECMDGTNQVVAEVILPHIDESTSILAAFVLKKELSIGSDSSERTNTGAVPLSADLKDKMTKRLPSYMLPNVLIHVEQLPMTATGKIDRKSLRELGRIILSNVPEHLPDTLTRVPEGSRDAEVILETEQPAYALAQKMVAILPFCYRAGIEVSAEGNVVKSFRNVVLASSGLDSINMMTLMYFISTKLGAKISIKFLMNETTSIRTLATTIVEMQTAASQEVLPKPVQPRHAASVDTLKEINRHDARISRHQANNASSAETHQPKANTRVTVFLTGANGYIGTQILRQLLESRQVHRVIALVRGSTPILAKTRLIDAAKNSLWWTELHEEKLDVWKGDLSLPRLGLNPLSWALLADGKSVDVIIHNGAAVHWGKSYAALEAINVCSTVDLLLLALSSPSTKLVYVSNRRSAESENETEESIARSILHVDSVAYSQTKFVSEALVSRAAHRSLSAAKNLAVVSPGYVVGTPNEGVANADDYIWRLVATCIRVGAYNTDEADTWLPLADATTTAAAITSSALNPEAGSRTVRPIMDGITWGGIWSILGGMGYRFQAMSADEWLAVVRADIEATGESHPLWPLAHILDRPKAQGEVKRDGEWRRSGETPLMLKIALRKSAESLSRVGYLPPPPSRSTDDKTVDGSNKPLSSTGVFFRGAGPPTANMVFGVA